MRHGDEWKGCVDVEQVEREVICPYCGKLAVMVKGNQIYGAFHRAAVDNFWVCWPCDAYVGTHKPNTRYNFDGTEPLGRLANQQLRRERIRVHSMLDPLWKDGSWGRQQSYDWLANRLGIPIDQCHIGEFDLEICKKAVGVLRGIRRMLDPDGKK